MQHFKLVNWWFRFLMSRTGFSFALIFCQTYCIVWKNCNDVFNILNWKFVEQCGEQLIISEVYMISTFLGTRACHIVPYSSSMHF